MEAIFIVLFLQLTESANQDGEATDDHHQLPTAGEHARTAAENRMFDEMNNDRTTPPSESGLLPVEEDDQGQQTPSKTEHTKM